MLLSVLPRYLIKIIPLALCALLLSWTTAARSQEIIVGQSAPLSGAMASTGKDMVLGGEIYFDYINSMGGINGHKIRHVVIDDGGDADRTLAATKRLINNEHAIVLFGYAGMDNLLLLLKDNILSDAKIALVGPYTGVEPLRTPYNANLFHIRAGYADETKSIATQLSINGITRVAVMYQDDAFGKSGLHDALVSLAAHKITPIVSSSYPKNTAEVSAAVTKIAAVTPQAVILISANRSSAAFIHAFRALGQTAIIFTISVVNPDILVKLTGASDIRGLRITQVVPDPITGVIPAAVEYRKLMKQYANGVPLSYTSFEEYLAAKVVVEGVRRSASINRASILNGLESIDHYDLGGFIVNYGKNNRCGSAYVDTVIVAKNGEIMR